MLFLKMGYVLLSSLWFISLMHSLLFEFCSAVWNPGTEGAFGFLNESPLSEKTWCNSCQQQQPVPDPGTHGPTDPRTHGPTDPRTHGPTDQRTDTPSYRVADLQQKSLPPIASLLQRWRTDDDWRTETEKRGQERLIKFCISHQFTRYILETTPA